MGHDRVRDIGLTGQDGGRLFELAAPVVVAVGERRHEPDLLPQQGVTDLDRGPVGGNHDHGSTGTDTLNGQVERALGAGRVDDHLVPVRLHCGIRQHRRPHLLGRLHLGGMASHDRGIPALMTGDGEDKLSDASRPDDEQRLLPSEPGEMEGVEGNGERFNQRRVGHAGPGGKRYQAARVNPHLIGQTAVDRNAVHPLHACAAQLILTGGTAVALPARDRGLHRYRRAVLEHPTELVTKGDG